ncbi:MAG: 2'-5' RNA ligase family protein [Clostridiales bacterium]|nr:2'-5' RNA ligase family protein [Clostridiales bacterium]
MKQDKFLTVFAVFDDATQRALKAFQDKVLSLGYKGTQTMGIPFHISLGSFKVEDERELKARIKEVCSQYGEFEINLNKVNHFNNRVLFIEPEENVKLRCLHNLFDNNFADGFPWHAHATIFCGDEEQVINAKQCLNEIFKPLKAKITGIQMGEFFPTRMIIEEKLCK